MDAWLHGLVVVGVGLWYLSVGNKQVAGAEKCGNAGLCVFCLVLDLDGPQSFVWAWVFVAVWLQGWMVVCVGLWYGLVGRKRCVSEDRLGNSRLFFHVWVRRLVGSQMFGGGPALRSDEL